MEVIKTRITRRERMRSNVRPIRDWAGSLSIGKKRNLKKKSGIMKIERGEKQLDKKKIMVNKQEANNPIGSSGRNVPFSDDRAGRRLSGGLCRDPFAGSSYGNERKTAQLSSGDGTQVCLFFPPF